MYARSTTIRGNATRLEDAVTHMRDEILPESTRYGFIGLSMLADRRHRPLHRHVGLGR